MIDDNFSDVPAEILRVSSDGGADWRGRLRREEAGQAKPTNWPPLNLGRFDLARASFLPICCTDQVLEGWMEGNLKIRMDVVDNPPPLISRTRG